MRTSIEEGEYEVDTINLLADIDRVEYKTKALDRIDIILDWLSSFTRRQQRVYKPQICNMLQTLKGILRDIQNAIPPDQRGSDSDSD